MADRFLASICFAKAALSNDVVAAAVLEYLDSDALDDLDNLNEESSIYDECGLCSASDDPKSAFYGLVKIWDCQACYGAIEPVENALKDQGFAYDGECEAYCEYPAMAYWWRPGMENGKRHTESINGSPAIEVSAVRQIVDEFSNESISTEEVMDKLAGLYSNLEIEVDPITNYANASPQRSAA